jgi:DNA repair protein RadC
MEDTLKHLTIKALAEDDRPREKLLSTGRHTLSDAELLAIILGSGSKNETAVQLAQRILSDNGHNMNSLAKLSIVDLKKYKGVGEAKAVNIAAAFEIGRRRTDVVPTERIKITSSVHAYQALVKRLSDLPHEEFWVLILNRANQVVKEECISKGGLASTIVDARIICKIAIENNASGIILSHNHPSGQVQPSHEDKVITKKLREALKLFDVNLFDHIIIGDQKYFSFNDEGLL